MVSGQLKKRPESGQAFPGDIRSGNEGKALETIFNGPQCAEYFGVGIEFFRGYPFLWMR